jgi:hypothetical protein
MNGSADFDHAARRHREIAQLIADEFLRRKRNCGVSAVTAGASSCDSVFGSAGRSLMREAPARHKRVDHEAAGVCISS